jgi:hypothetical protein
MDRLAKKQVSPDKPARMAQLPRRKRIRFPSTIDSSPLGFRRASAITRWICADVASRSRGSPKSDPQTGGACDGLVVGAREVFG